MITIQKQPKSISKATEEAITESLVGGQQPHEADQYFPISSWCDTSESNEHSELINEIN